MLLLNSINFFVISFSSFYDLHTRRRMYDGP